MSRYLQWSLPRRDLLVLTPHLCAVTSEGQLAFEVRLPPLNPKLSAKLSVLAAGAGSLFAGPGTKAAGVLQWAQPEGNLQPPQHPLTGAELPRAALEDSDAAPCAEVRAEAGASNDDSCMALACCARLVRVLYRKQAHGSSVVCCRSIWQPARRLPACWWIPWPACCGWETRRAGSQVGTREKRAAGYLCTWPRVLLGQLASCATAAAQGVCLLTSCRLRHQRQAGHSGGLHCRCRPRAPAAPVAGARAGPSPLAAVPLALLAAVHALRPLSHVAPAPKVRSPGVLHIAI